MRDKIKSVLASYLKGEITSIDEAVEQVICCVASTGDCRMASSATARERVAHAIHEVTNRWIRPNFPVDHKLQSFEELADRERRLNLDYADAAIAVLCPAQRKPTWSPDLSDAPSGWHNYFLVRPQGLHPARGTPLIPSVAQRVDGEFYGVENEIEPMYFGQNEPDDSPLKTTLEWQPLPSDWLTTSDVQSPAESAAAPASASVEAVAAVLKGWLGDYLAATPPLGKISKALAAAALGSAADRDADAADAATLRGFIKEHGMAPSMMASEVETLRAQVKRLTAAAAPFVGAARAMYQPGHCGGQSPQDWPKSWRVWIVAEDREKREWEPQWHTPLTVGDFRALEGAVELALAAPAADQPKLQADQAATQHDIMMRVFDWAYLHATEGMAWPSPCTAERAIELAKDRAPTQADADTIKETIRFPSKKNGEAAAG